MTRSVILTVVGSDRPGLTQALADAVMAAGGNWLESHLARLGGKYVGSVLVELAAESLDRLEAECHCIDAVGLHVTVVDAGSVAEDSGQSVGLELVGQDRPGIVREVTTVLTGLNVNIDELETAVENSAWSGARLFRARARLRMPDSTTLEALREALERISSEIMADIHLQPRATECAD